MEKENKNLATLYIMRSNTEVCFIFLNSITMYICCTEYGSQENQTLNYSEGQGICVLTIKNVSKTE
jgi:hypothetical protein